MQCREAVDHLYTFLDEELTPDLRSAVRAHIEGCQHCFGQFEFERVFLLFVEARCRAQCAPPELKKRIFEKTLLERDAGA